ncbi:hypothetical protein ACFW5I_36685 [Streptomyces sp. NPDC058818]|uniref:hypothetical protein n=1 Tax=Streptomyces sp. NPDC058818 TaxID=3346640 RepID=UPI003688F4A0
MMMASSWYESPLLWSAASVLVGLLAVWATLRAANPKRHLAYTMRSIAPLIPSSGPLRDGLAMNLNGIALQDPHVLQFELANWGRRDIPSSAFDSGMPIRIDLGCDVVSILETASKPSHAVPPAVSADGQSILVGPGLIARGQRITITVLADGPRPELTAHVALIDVRVRQDQVRKMHLLWLPVILSFSACSILWILGLGVREFDQSLGSSFATAAQVFAFVGAGAAMSPTQEWLDRRSRRV